MKILNYNEVDVKEGICGKIKEGFRDEIGFARAEMREGTSTAHYHKKTLEYYLVIAGEGILRTQTKGGELSEVQLKQGIL